MKDEDGPTIHVLSNTKSVATLVLFRKKQMELPPMTQDSVVERSFCVMSYFSDVCYNFVFRWFSETEPEQDKQEMGEPNYER